MKSNNPFQTHGIEHLSPSKINLWVADPALFVGTYLCDMKGSFGVGAFRGTAVEHALQKKITNKELWCDYVTKKEAISFKVQNVEQRLNEVIKIAFGLQKFLSISDDPFELASILYPNYDDWRWNDEMKKQSTKIWSNK